jgi:hypothetical protein
VGCLFISSQTILEMTNVSKPYWKGIYDNPENLVEIKFSNTSDTVKYVWIEPAAYSLELKPGTEYKLFTHERHFSIDYTSDMQFTLWTDASFGFILYKRDAKEPAGGWELDIDLSEIQ